MPTAFMMINVEPGTEDQVVDEVRKIKGVKDSHVVFGIYDIIAKVEVDSVKELRSLVLSQVRSLKVRSTQTVIVAEGPKHL